jgi:rubrerythrin
MNKTSNRAKNVVNLLKGLRHQTPTAILATGGLMATFTCEKCGKVVDTRCKPKKCPDCGEPGVMCKQDAPAPKKTKGK